VRVALVERVLVERTTPLRKGPVLHVMQTPASVMSTTRACHSLPAAVRMVSKSPTFTLGFEQYAPH
jgi:hypothetical protein